jgi:hypothetical protein
MRSIPSFSRSEMIAADNSCNEYCSLMDDSHHLTSTTAADANHHQHLLPLLLISPETLIAY